METLKNITECDLNVDIPVTCLADEIIAVHSLQYAYDNRCVGTCCSYISTDCFVNAGGTDIQKIRRVCSGRSCNLPISTDKIDFATCSLGVLDISYIFLQYYCLPNDRISSICASGQTLTSDGAPLYLTNDNYPSVTIGNTSCYCSLEVYSCSSNINLYTVDADLYLDTSTCLQNLNFLNGSDQTLHTIGCESHYLDQIEINTANSHYLKIDFINNSTAHQEGYFFIGLEASESGASFSLRCNYEQETWCVGCGAVPIITNGQVELSKVNDFSYGAAANVACDSGYETQTPAISCLANGSWPAPVCTEKAACTASQWRCSNGDCIVDSQRCDNFPDCVDQSDEDNCGTACTASQWKCSNGDCIEDNQRCDNVPDCVDQSDENNCGVPSCPEGLEFCQHDNGTNVCVDEAVGCSCGSAPSISNGVITAVSSTIGSVADVTCAEGYNPSAPNVTCLTSSSWETASCTAKDKITPADGAAKDDKSSVNIALIIVLVILGVLLLVQLGIMCFLQCQIHNIRSKAEGGDTRLLKWIGMTILGCVPILGLIPIYITWKEFYRDVYQGTNRETDYSLQYESIDNTMQETNQYSQLQVMCESRTETTRETIEQIPTDNDRSNPTGSDYINTKI